MTVFISRSHYHLLFSEHNQLGIHLHVSLMLSKVCITTDDFSFLLCSSELAVNREHHEVVGKGKENLQHNDSCLSNDKVRQGSANFLPTAIISHCEEEVKPHYV